MAAAQAERPPAPTDEDAPPVDEADTIGEDDVVLEDDTRSHTDLLRETLGAEVIDEQPN
jgi:DNA polymerase-3 subunit gamma/tau